MATQQGNEQKKISRNNISDDKRVANKALPNMFPAAI
jgi:hypothetical protein